jgi:aspartyl/asparaginyl beta-hydroxylase (cupin superfamily)
LGNAVVLDDFALFQAFFSILDGGKSIPRHAAPYRGYLRYHLGLKVPKLLPAP